MGETNFVTPDVDTSHPKDGDEAYQQEMIAKAEGGLGSETEAKLFAGKYKTEEDLQKGVLELIKHQNDGDLESFYVNLQKGMGKKTEEPADTEQETSPQQMELDTSDETEGDAENNQEENTPVQLDFDRYSKEYAQTGQISDETKEELRTAGISDEMMDTYIAGLVSLQKANNEHAYGVVGGEENYAKMAQFAKQHLTVEEREAYNKSIQTKDLAAREEAINVLWNKYTEANPQFIEGGSVQSSVPEGAFANENEFRAAMKDPRYNKDASYRDTVLAKLERSKFF